MNQAGKIVSATAALKAPDVEVGGKRELIWRSALGVIAIGLVLALSYLTVPHLTKNNLDMCVQQQADESHINLAALNTDLKYQPEFTEIMTLCEAAHP
jgi:anti-sigma-K factor RskA